MKQIVLLCTFIFPILCISQTLIEGRLLDNSNNPITRASITITALNRNDILAYDISDNEGYYSIAVESDLKSFILIVRSIGFKTLEISIDNISHTENLVLTDEVTELKEVVLKASPITQKGDTINYNVNAFAKQEDRTIADVLKNMPGIEVLVDGKILYQGKPINKYYIDGLDLLEGKYNLANNNLPFYQVTNVQVLENHQPIKILDSLVFSDQSALNIKLKHKYTFTGQAEVGAGLTPLLWHLNATPMLFTKKQQMLASYQTNNTGNNVASQLKKMTIEDLLEQFDRNNEKQDWLGIQQLAIPNFNEDRWLDNTIHLFTTNYLQKLKNDYELRINSSYLNDYQKQNGITNTQFFTNNDTIALFENKYNQIYTNTFDTNITFQKNTGKNYFKNSLQFQGFWDSQRGTIQSNNSLITQNLSNPYSNISNDLKALFPLGRQIITLNSYIGLNKTPQKLMVNPGSFNDLLNNGNTYDEVVQHIDLKTFYTNNSIGLVKGWKNFSFSPKVGIQFEKQNLESSLTTSSGQNASNTNNDLDWLRYSLYTELKTQFRKDKLRLELSTPLNFHNYTLEDSNLQRGQHLNKLTFEPKLSINYDLNSYWQFGTTGNISNQFGTINQVYYSYILQNYRNIQRIDTPLPQMQIGSYSGSLRYKNPLKSIFFSVVYSNTTREYNLLYNNLVMENGATELKAIEQDNKRHNHTIMSRGSKYISDLKTNLTLGLNYSLQDFVQIINSDFTTISNQNWRYHAKVDTDITDWLSTEIESIWQFSNNEIQGQTNETITQQFHKLNINVYPKDNHYFALKSEYIKNDLFSDTAENLFTDIVYRYTYKKKNIDFELQWSNIFNTINYRTVNINNFSYTETNFSLRPSQVLFKIRFSF